VKKKISFTKMLEVSSKDLTRKTVGKKLKAKSEKKPIEKERDEIFKKTAKSKENKKGKKNLQSKNKIVLFRIATEYYGVSVSDIEEIIETKIREKIAGMPDFTVGVFDLRKEAVPVISLFEKFHLRRRETTEKETVLLLRRGKKTYGILIDELIEVIDIETSKILNVPKIFSPEEETYLKGIVKFNTEVVALIDIGKVLEMFKIGL